MKSIKKIAYVFMLGLVTTSALANSTSTVKYDYSLIQSKYSLVPLGPWAMEINAQQAGKKLQVACNGAACPSVINEGELITAEVNGKNYPPVVTEIRLKSPTFINAKAESKYNVCHIELVYSLIGSQNISIFQEGSNGQWPIPNITRSDSLVCDAQ